MRTALLYLFLVGVPVAGTVAVLLHGHDLQAPPALGGNFQIEQGGACAGGPGTPLQFVQSGSFADLLIDDASGLHGRVNQAGEIRLSGGPCGRLEGRVARDGHMQGTLGGAPFSAARVVPTESDSH